MIGKKYPNLLDFLRLTFMMYVVDLDKDLFVDSVVVLINYK